jgi:cobaltochelatase CobT
VTRWYRRAVTLADVEQLGGAMVENLAALFAQEAQAGRRKRAA